MFKVNIAKNSGFCFGVQFAITMAEDFLHTNQQLYSLGELVHNENEVARLKSKGLNSLSISQFAELKNETVLIRAHGEPPSTYKLAYKNNITLIDASCPVVLKLQRRVNDFFKHGYQIIIYGKLNHPEVIGLNGQCNNQAIILSDIADINNANIDFTKKTVLISQTTKSTAGLYDISAYLSTLFLKKKTEFSVEIEFISKDTLCRQVSSRDEILRNFAKENDVVLFVAGEKSSNGKVLFEVCRYQNNQTYLIKDENDINYDWFKTNLDVTNIGICGATSTPMWLIERIAKAIDHHEKVLMFNHK